MKWIIGDGKGEGNTEFNLYVYIYIFSCYLLVKIVRVFLKEVEVNNVFLLVKCL